MTAPAVTTATALVAEQTNAEESFVAAMAAKADAPTPVTEQPPKTADSAARLGDAAPSAASSAITPAPAAVTPPADATATDGEEGTDGTPPVTAPEETEPTETDVDEAFAAAMKAQRADPSLDGVPKEAQAVVRKKLKDLEAGFTRTMQQVRADQKAALAVKAEARFQQERPADYITTLLMANPDLMAQVNERLDAFEKAPSYKAAHADIVATARATALKAEEDALAQAQAAEQAVAELERMGKAASSAYGVPFEAGVEAEIAARLATGATLTEADIRAIAKEKATIWKRLMSEHARDKSKQYVAGKVQDRATAGLAVRPSTGQAHTAGKAPVPKDDEEFIAQFVGR